MHARACASARLRGAATSAAYTDHSRTVPQLPGGNRSRAQYACDQHRKERCPDFAHERPSFLVPTDEQRSGYFTRGCAGPGSLTHPPVVPLRISQRHGPAQCTVRLQVPLQTGRILVGVRSCRAETVPAPRTAAAIAAKNAFFSILFMIDFSFLHKPGRRT